MFSNSIETGKKKEKQEKFKISNDINLD